MRSGRSAGVERGRVTPVLVVMGVSGSGKSTVARLLAEKLGWDMLEGDDLHPETNVAKMASGTPLTDEDRWPWLRSIASWIDTRQSARRPGIVTCSALKRSYRDVLRRDGVIFVHLSGNTEQIRDRIGHRAGHFMPASLLQSQVDTLEPLEPDENGIVVEIGRPPEEEVAEVIAQLPQQN
ncbi:gluconokinase [Nocardia cyriacigeorgica]|uniref:gluconokinase n=1 Tax=Nocardia cyriacigeorgica TaxID=135487 RepID=UPI001032FADB|nr:gluconokinase [Nocardia cyriacigeorgica]MBF6162179.1 gluconokinase [Nocardia cyriacigeorgica]MBF6200759.1 gluconokinase [Nocardia cyriacigeorgica]MBF6320408.1 gluconokinase [Nocardia cyriacigeorgica]MBF6518020.1 gluconokinase [Nocardia cyriacigeorgica]MBF6534895.1 gluconokinase [Nocardia cyriacigeorgica]